ncbi:hypothetical protein [uncultured Williamsia sp.]|uniref:hypothetical protein n=1 Tax=uncultured Williamsia sp. TaxID=259311 RepID=UPI00262A0F1F|nr:hypothetical protein [uncultured Williamsia sp.]
MTTLLDHRSTTAPCASAHFPGLLPRAVRADADSLTWESFLEAYAPGAGIRLGSWHATPARNDLTEYHATIAAGDRIWSLRESTTGPLAAATAMLHATGTCVEITGLHQQRVGTQTVMLVEVECDGRRAWGLGIDDAADRAGVVALLNALDRAA